MSSLLFTLASVYGHALPSVQHSNRPFDAGHSPQSTINLIVTVNKIKKKMNKKKQQQQQTRRRKKKGETFRYGPLFVCVCVHALCVARHSLNLLCIHLIWLLPQMRCIMRCENGCDGMGRSNKMCVAKIPTSQRLKMLSLWPFLNLIDFSAHRGVDCGCPPHKQLVRNVKWNNRSPLSNHHRQ